MDALKNPTNLGGTSTTSQQSGEEPVSGEKGTGTATEPYDQGNAEGKEGAAPKEGMAEALEDTKDASANIMGGA
ncbi:hypothetical protein JMJ35_009655 [Cladonia borealis]|uniref:Uncharacterized protein n=1 Tax=Cladonia borealis TaxID=184061 RepID=A0AA39QSQ6_9LECA|nr:hypothetical protein JMJ35_009655 [Cladonia borealis]